MSPETGGGPTWKNVPLVPPWEKTAQGALSQVWLGCHGQGTSCLWGTWACASLGRGTEPHSCSSLLSGGTLMACMSGQDRPCESCASTKFIEYISLVSQENEMNFG